MDQRTALAWGLVILGIIALVLGLFAGVVSWEVTLALIVIGFIAVLGGGLMLLRSRRPS